MVHEILDGGGHRRFLVLFTFFQVIVGNSWRFFVTVGEKAKGKCAPLGRTWRFESMELRDVPALSFNVWHDITL